MVSYILRLGVKQRLSHGGVAERLKAPVLKTGEARASVGSNPTLSAKCFLICFFIRSAEVPKRPKGLPC